MYVYVCIAAVTTSDPDTHTGREGSVTPPLPLSLKGVPHTTVTRAATQEKTRIPLRSDSCNTKIINRRVIREVILASYRIFARIYTWAVAGICMYSARNVSREYTVAVA
jgi:hypothetical protein